MFGIEVQLENAAFIHPTAKVYGKVKLKEGSSLWPYAVIRAEMHEVVIAEKTNIQDFVMIHVGLTSGTKIGSHCSVTHHSTLHGCTIGDNCLIGINATIMDGCIIGNNCIVAGHTFLKEGSIIPDNSIVAGNPGKVIKTRNNYVANRINALAYYENALGYAQGDHRRLSDAKLMKKLDNLKVELSSKIEPQRRII